MAAGIGLAIVEVATARQFRGEHVVIRLIVPAISRTAWLIVLRLRPLSRLALELIEAIKEAAVDDQPASGG